jgi:hypothetical protein
MENWYFILVPVALISGVLVFKFFKLEQDYKSKSKEIQQKIEEIKKRNTLIENKKITILEQSGQVNQIFKQVCDLHKLVFHKYFR